jgi:dolichyl-diphosphooligosaccharide--protein glycosyltransferase
VLADSLFFVIGTAGALQVPVIGWQPLQSLEQLGPLGIFVVLQVIFLADIVAGVMKMSDSARDGLRVTMVVAGGAIAVAVLMTAMDSGYLGPVSARVRGLFIKHTKTGNPLVDSVAEHQATPTRAYWRYFHMVMYLAPVGLGSLVMKKEARTDSEWFIMLYTVIAWYFSQKMIRLVLLLGPAAAVTAGQAVCIIVSWSIEKVQTGSTGQGGSDVAAREKAEARARRSNERRVAELEGDTAKLRQLALEGEDDDDEISPEMQWGVAVVALVLVCLCGQAFLWHCRRMAEALSEPQIMSRMREPDTEEIVIVDDYREAYGFLKEHTPEDARVLAWWDYGYQITGVGNRTTVADGNTWNHEHIALLGRCLVMPEQTSHEITRHLADYVLVVTTRHAGTYTIQQM